MDARRIQEAHDLLPEELRAVEEAYPIFRQYTAPFMMSVAAEMLDGLKKDVETDSEGRRAAFPGIYPPCPDWVPHGVPGTGSSTLTTAYELDAVPSPVSPADTKGST
ncbi:hypothetical protein [Nocardiopsis ganjiahuensis]|uniref:hypothetical protein n=1 Tax=Nocardiopsis ganjiahuensis TaxID=239984 RepID=UPI0003450F1D|nr:hypothetical protein [Nocardiopsis ganjiahuensis]